MQSLAAANEEVARILLHLGRSCIQHKSLESSEDEEEEEEEEEEKEKEESSEEVKKEKENNETQKVNRKKKNLLEKLYSSYNQRLVDFVSSSQWPDYQLSPSSLLDGLFDTSFEGHPNVLIITLYSVDIGYSIKMTVDDNNSPIETYFNYEQDSILEYIKNEEIPPHLLDLLEKAKPPLFYCGCVIAEIHDKKTDQQMISRILLRPSNMSVLSDLNQLLAYSNTLNWSYEEKIKLESLLMLASQPELCIDSTPSVGQAVRLLYDMYALRRKELNPLKNNQQITYNIFDSGSIREIYHKSSNSFFNDVQKNSNLAKSANCNSNVNMNCHLMWEFDFRLDSVTLIKLSILVVVKTQEYSLLLNFISEVNSVLRFKINLKTNNLKAYISIILEILKEKVDSRISVVRTYKSGSKPSYVKFLPMLFNDNIHEPSKIVISQLLDNLLKCKLENTCNNFGIAQKKSLNLVSSTNSSQNVLKKNKSYNSILRKRAKIICKNFNVLSEDLKTDSEKCYMKRRKCSIAKMLLHSKKNTETSTSNNANVLENGAESNHGSRLKDLESPPLSPLAVGLSASSSMTCVTSVSSPVTDTYSTVIQIENEQATLKQEVQNHKHLASLELHSIALAPFVSSSSSEMSFVSNTDMELSSVSSPINVVSSVSSPITVVSSTLSKVSSTEAISINSLLASQSLTLQTDRKLLSAFRGQRVRINTKLKSVHSTKNQHLKLLLSNCDAAKTSHIIKQNPPQNINDVIKTASGTLLTQYVKMKPGGKSAVHKNGISNAGQTIYKKIICGNAVGNVNKTMPQLAASLQRTSAVDQTTTNCQLDRRKTKVINNLLNSKDLITSQPNIPISLPGVIVPKNTTSLNQFNNHHQVNIAPRSSNSSVSSFTCQTLNNIKPAIMGSISTANNTQ
ncbi:uncharacterized protein LOC126846915 isoform X2 [Adelges cooleyi]|uniref:uncharacterized protein LOC126846915 isoform X2 n=1 Tax=Adelges cooleyi TaxID=133065 RepID=UPI00217F7EAA|nr:uncharacterized protein LOC126846915 isoform X2 [Adelges cooleyi]